MAASTGMASARPVPLIESINSETWPASSNRYARPASIGICIAKVRAAFSARIAPNAQVLQQMIATLGLGRFEDLQASGQLERLVRSGARFATKAMVLSGGR